MDIIFYVLIKYYKLQKQKKSLQKSDTERLQKVEEKPKETTVFVG